MSHASIQNSRDALQENEQVIETLRNRVKELESSLQQDGKSDSSDNHGSERTWSASKVTFSEVNTLLIENGQRQSSSVNGSATNINIADGAHN